MCSKLFATFVPFSVLSPIRPHTIKVASTSRLSFNASHVRKIPGSPRLHNFNVRVPECGSLGTRLAYLHTCNMKLAASVLTGNGPSCEVELRLQCTV